MSPTFKGRAADISLNIKVLHVYFLAGHSVDRLAVGR